MGVRIIWPGKPRALAVWSEEIEGTAGPNVHERALELHYEGLITLEGN
jgi:hypothetical protein